MSDDPGLKLQRRKRWLGWHRWFGVTASLFVIVLSVSGMALNHTRELHLGERHIGNELLLSLYSVQAPGQGQQFVTGKLRIHQLGRRLYWGDEYLGELEQQLLGVVEDRGLFLMLLSDELQIRDSSGQLLEQIGALDGLPAQATRIGLSRSAEVILQSPRALVRFDFESVTWQRLEAGLDTDWSSASAIPGPEYERIAADWRRRVISVERVLLDVHSGRLFSMPGVLFMDAVAVMLVFLAGSGLWLWWGRRP